MPGTAPPRSTTSPIIRSDPSTLFEVRNNYTDPYTETGPLLTYLRAMGIDGQGAAALPATPGYDDSTGVGSPNRYIQSFQRGGHSRH